MELRKTLLVLGTLLCAQIATANQLWHQVNRYDENGAECPLRQAYNQTCYSLCVSDLSKCPDNVRPACPEGQSFCADGHCHDECTAKINAANPCFCLQKPSKIPSEALSLVPCGPIPKVNITQFHPWDPKPDIRNRCGEWAGITDQSQSVSIWGSMWATGDMIGVWADCPAPPHANYKYNEGYWIATFAVNGALAFIIGVWSLYKRWAERGVHQIASHTLDASEAKRSAATAAAANTPIDDVKAEKGAAIAFDDDSDERNTLDKTARPGATTINGASPSLLETTDSLQRDISLKGYRDHFLGTLGIWSIGGVMILWICYLGVWTTDYYGSMPGWRHGVVSSLAYKDDYLELATFLIVWGLSFLFLIVLYILKPHLRNFFRVQTLPATGQYVCVVRPVHEVKLVAEQPNVLQEAINRITERLSIVMSQDRTYTTCPVERTSEGRIYFTYQCTRYVFDDQIGQYAPFDFDLGTTNRGLISQAGGLSSEDALYRSELVGPNFIQVEVPGVFMAFVRELVSFFYIYQFIFLWAFYFYAYYQVGLVDTGVIMISATIKVLLRMGSEKRLKRMAEQEEMISVKRDGQWIETSTKGLVPGDVIEIISGSHMSCDCILLSGSAIMDESSLTGEPLPIRKFPLRLGEGHYDPEGAGKMSTLYAGTIVSQVQPILHATDQLESDRVLALVNRTGTSSDKGQLVRKILFPNPISFIFNEQMRIVVFILILYSVFVMAMAAYLYKGNNVAIVFYGVFAIAQLLSPLLPAALVIGQSIAAARLRKKQIFCVDPQRIMIAGKVQIFCFDKTGTLTKEGLEYYGGQCIDKQTGVFNKFQNTLSDNDVLFQQAVASCHAVTDLNGQLIGNPVDIEQFRASKSTIDPAPRYLDAIIPADSAKHGILHVVRRFEFVHARASMSVAILDETTGKLHVFVKGSFERIRQIANSNSVPSDYDDTCAGLAREGCYVLSIAHKELDIPLEKIKDLTQDELEGDCDLLGLLVFKNMLKTDTESAIGELKGGSTRTVMITGDTALTGVYIARQCGMIPPNNKVLLGDCKSTMDDVQWIDVDTMEAVGDIAPYLVELGQDGYPTTELALTGTAFSRLNNTGAIDSILFHTRVFARMKPVNKVECIELHMKYGITAMCGDGGNDCGALRAAHVGIALSDAEASIVSPFSSANRSIYSCVELLIQSRAGLATSFANFAALICYGQIMSGMVKMASFYFAISLTQNLWMLIDGAIATGLAMTVSMSGPAKKLAPYRPTTRILGPQMLASVGGIALINWLFSAMAYVWLFQQPWFRCNEHASAEVDVTKWWLLGDNYEASILSFVSTFQFINNGFVVNYGHLYRARWYKNYSLLVIWAFLMTFVSYMLLANPNRVGCAFRLNCGTDTVLESLHYPKPTWKIEPYNSPLGHNVIPRNSRWALWGYCLGNMATTNFWQVFVINGPMRSLLRKKKPLRRLKIKL
ncbi:hypothetical protein DL89DRAFT_325643 [Linderina pennispora]|uniref:P-type ATPase A domain-containing protein n=1 Tax=Linderina pennispora TaxID=61395 RepID=A0A1Y1VW19_9FUNG|nr:uncharacterized protein DL89DRAFT_325643 [Linderina pennispora]ORX65480.1 hypothetical protein DL89DRAFT_325643 [Linderina pennispora]